MQGTFQSLFADQSLQIAVLAPGNVEEPPIRARMILINRIPGMRQEIGFTILQLITKRRVSFL